MINKAMVYFSEIDYLGREFKFEHSNNIRHKTPYGAFFSLITFSAAFVFAILFGQEVYQRKNPNISSGTERVEDTYLYLEDFPMFFTFRDSFADEYNFTETFDMYITWTHFPSSENPGSLPSVYLNNSLVPCEEVFDRYKKTPEIDNFIEKYAKNTSATEYCLNFTENMYVRREIATDSSVFLGVYFSFCDPKTRDTCKYDKERFYKTGAAIGISFLDSYTDPINYSNPVVPYYNMHIQLISEGLKVILFFDMIEDTLISDDGWMTEDFREISYFTYKYKTDINMIDVKEGTDNRVLDFVLSFPRLRTKTVRNYLKVQELLARVGGLANAFMISIKILTYHFMKYKYYFFIHENSFAIVEEDFKSKIPNRLKDNIQNLEGLNTKKQNNNSIMPRLLEANKPDDRIKNSEDEKSISKNINLSEMHPFKKPSFDVIRDKNNKKSNINNYIKPGTVNNNKDLPRDKDIDKDKEVDVNKEDDKDSSKKIEDPKKESLNTPEPRKLISKSVSIKKERKDLIIGSQANYLEPSEISYWNYLKARIFTCLANDELQQKYENEVKRITQLLDIKSLYQFLVEGYSSL